MKKIIMIVGLIIVIFIVVLFITYNVMFIGKKEVKKIVLNDLNIKETDVRKMNVDFEFENGSFEYKVEFIYNNLEYEYVIDAKNGDIIIHGIDR